MTIPSTTNRQVYNGSGTTGPFTGTWRVTPNGSDLKIYKKPADSAAVLLTSGDDYTLTLLAEGLGGYSITTTENVETGEKLIVVRDPQVLQSTSFRTQGSYRAEVHEKAFDLLTMIAQRLVEKASRSIVLNDADDTIDMTLPEISEIADHVLAFNSSGEPVASNLTLAELEAQPAAAATSATAAAASATAAATSATSAATSATNANTSATAAAAAQAAAEAASNGFKWKTSARFAADADVTLSAPGSTIDGGSPSNGDRILLPMQSDPTENGVYQFNGAASAMTRTTDADTWDEIVSMAIQIDEGSSNAGSIFIATINAGGTLETDDITYTELNSSLPSQAANSILANATSSSAQPTALAVSANRLVGRGSSGDLTNITVGTNLEFDGTTLNVLSQAVAGLRRNLVVEVKSATQVDITADSLVLTDGTNFIRLDSVDISSSTTPLLITNSGASGLDAGSEGSSKWYYVYVIYDGTNVRGLLSESATSPTLPGSYTYYARVGTVRNDASSNLWRTLQKGDRVSIRVGTNPTAMPQISSGVQGSQTIPTWVSKSVSSYVPPTARDIDLFLTAIGFNTGVMVAPNNSYGTVISSTNPPPLTAPAGTNFMSSQRATMMLESTDIYVASAGGPVCVCGWVES